jgi:hypothetical protein
MKNVWRCTRHDFERRDWAGRPLVHAGETAKAAAGVLLRPAHGQKKPGEKI